MSKAMDEEDGKEQAGSRRQEAVGRSRRQCVGFWAIELRRVRSFRSFECMRFDFRLLLSCFLHSREY